MRYRVDDVPWLWRPIWLGYSWLVGSGGWAVLQLLHLTCRVHVEGREPLTVTEDNFAEAGRLLAQRMSGPEGRNDLG